MSSHTETRFPNRMTRLLRFPSSAGNMKGGLLLGLRAAQLALAFIIMALMAYVADWYNSDTLTMAPPQVNWQLACSVISILSLIYLEGAKRFAPRAFHSAAALGLESANAVFHFSGFIYLAVFIGKLLFCRGSVCAAARAASVFGAFEFLFWCVSAALAAKEVAAGGFSLPFRRSPKPANEKVVAMEEGARA
ncbi:hypothetical protein MGN70_012369 [Eutypa lata]|nr:hypothetical protein MGN70_012369 [Eutypa lata]